MAAEMNVPSEDELRALFDKGGFDAVQADAEAAADRDAKQTFSDAFAKYAPQPEPKVLPKCEFPKPDGKGICGAEATQVVTISGFRWSYNAKACDKCAAAVEKEARINATKDR
jgi:hypothetical protein